MGTPQKQEEIAVTTVESNDHRHLVQPYKERPIVELKQGEVACPFCGNPQFRRSRLRFIDLFEVLMLRYPVRCTRCAKRQFTDIYIAMLSYPAKFHGGSVAQGDTSWKSWTDRSASGKTAMESRAQNVESISKAPSESSTSSTASQEKNENIA